MHKDNDKEPNGGKQDQNRISDQKAYGDNWERIYSKKYGKKKAKKEEK